MNKNFDWKNGNFNEIKLRFNVRKLRRIKWDCRFPKWNEYLQLKKWRERWNWRRNKTNSDFKRTLKQ